MDLIYFGSVVIQCIKEASPLFQVHFMTLPGGTFISIPVAREVTLSDPKLSRSNSVHQETKSNCKEGNGGEEGTRE